MPKPSFAAILNLADPMLNDNFELRIPNVPGGGILEGDRLLTLQCKTATKPGTQIEEVLVELFGHKTVHAAKRSWTNDLPVEYLEDRNGTITKILENWAELIRAESSQHGAFKNEYARDGEFIIYDQHGDIAMKYKILNMWPSEVPEAQFDGTGGAQITLSASFKFDHVIRLTDAYRSRYAS